MIALIITLTVIVAILLVLIVLAQDPKTGGFQSGAAGAQMGVKKTTDLLERLTWGFIIGVFVLAIGSSFVISNNDDAGLNSINIERAAQSNTVEKAPAQQPAQGQDAQKVDQTPQPSDKPADQKQP